MAIVAFAQFAMNPLASALAACGVVLDAGARLTSAVDFTAKMEYTVGAYRESQVYDSTEENAYVELPQMYSTMCIGIVYNDYSLTEGIYYGATWSVITQPSYYPSGNDKKVYAEYAANIYYRNCVINGKWIHGRTAYGGLGG